MAVINRRKLTGTGVSPSHVEEFLDTLDAGLDEQLNILMDGAPDGTAGTPVTWGFQLVSIKGDAVAESHIGLVLKFLTEPIRLLPQAMVPSAL